jgi:uncharacterized membrane protein YqhA
MFKHLLKVRYIVVVIAFFAVLHALAFLVMGAQSAVKAYGYLLNEKGVGETTRPGLELLHSLDFFFVAMVLVVLALGIAKLFLLDPSADATAELPAWLRIDSISELKVLLWETILTTLLILGLSDLTATVFSKPDWTILLMPVSILVLALSLYFMKKT